MKILATFLVSSVFAFMPAVCHTQDNYFVPQKDCGTLLILANATAIEELADKQDCISGNQKQLKTSVEDLRFRMRNNETDVLILQDKLKLEPHTDETRIENLEASIHLLEGRLSMAEDKIEWLTRKAPARKPASGFIPDSPSKSTSDKPKTTSSKTTAAAKNPTPATKEQTR